jgi:hypothetical protein
MVSSAGRTPATAGARSTCRRRPVFSAYIRVIRVICVISGFGSSLVVSAFGKAFSRTHAGPLKAGTMNS